MDCVKFVKDLNNNLRVCVLWGELTDWGTQYLLSVRALRAPPLSLRFIIFINSLY